MGGETVCVEAKKMYPDVPIIILTAKDSTADVVRGLEDLGADDYIAKPFETEELLARIKARLRKGGNNSSRLEIADLILDTKTLEVKRGDKKIELTPQEFKLLEYLMSNKGKVMTRDAILNRVWLYSPDIETRVVDVYVGYLRKKIDEGFDKPLIHSVRGFGYVVKEED
jgi:DNA-binding response OmpR family regulator